MTCPLNLRSSLFIGLMGATLLIGGARAARASTVLECLGAFESEEFSVVRVADRGARILPYAARATLSELMEAVWALQDQSLVRNESHGNLTQYYRIGDGLLVTTFKDRSVPGETALDIKVYIEDGATLEQVSSSLSLLVNQGGLSDSNPVAMGLKAMTTVESGRSNRGYRVLSKANDGQMKVLWNLLGKLSKRDDGRAKSSQNGPLQTRYTLDDVFLLVSHRIQVPGENKRDLGLYVSPSASISKINEALKFLKENGLAEDHPIFRAFPG